MSKTLSEVKPKTRKRKAYHVADIVHHGDKLMLPDDMSIPQAITLLEKRNAYLEQSVEIHEDFNVFPWDGAFAISQVLCNLFGWSNAVPTPGLFGEYKPQIIKVKTAHGMIDVPWGCFSLPGVDGMLSCGTSRDNRGRVKFRLEAEIKRKDENLIRKLFEMVRQHLAEKSIYRGQAVKIRFKDSDGEYFGLPEPDFIDVSKATRESLILSKELEAAIEACLFTPIGRVKDCIRNGIKVKRGVILGGKYGTGKTLAATVAARIATDAGITFVYCPRADELADAIEFAKMYQSPACVIFCEDIDRAIHGERSVEMDDILNILDGLDSKQDNIVTVLTTNHLDNINQAMLRPGRLDSIINVTPPDADAAERLVRYYGGKSIDAGEDLETVGAVLDGQIPAVIEEVVKRAKLFQLALLKPGETVSGVTSEALLNSAQTMATQISLLEEKAVEEKPSLDRAMREVVSESVRAH